MQERYRTLVYLLAYGGLRIGEAAGLRLEHLNLLQGRVQVVQSLSEVGGRIHIGPTKTRSRRTVSLPPFLRAMLEDHISEYSSRDGFVFSAPEGGPIRPRNFRARAWDPAVMAAGVSPLRIHDLRHTCAALLIEQGAHIKEVADRLGHSSPVVTMNTYAHILPSLKARLSDGLENAFRQAVGESAASVLLPLSRIESSASPTT
jgi:integrase